MTEKPSGIEANGCARTMRPSASSASRLQRGREAGFDARGVRAQLLREDSARSPVLGERTVDREPQ